MRPPPMIETRELAKSFGAVPAVTGLNLAIPAGATCCLLGPNGAGKTTVVRMLSTLLRPDAGSATVAGHDVATEAPAVRGQIGLSGQNAAVDEFLSGRANLVMLGQLARLRRRAAVSRAGDLLGFFDLGQAADRQVRTYSGGMRRRLDLAASLITRPPVLFLDEPTTGLDPRSRLSLWEVIRGLAAGGTTVLLTTQYLEEADRLADLVCVMNRGRAVAWGTPADLKASLGGATVTLTIADRAPLGRAVAVLARHACAPVRSSGEGRRLEVPVVPRPGLVTELVRELDQAGVAVDEIGTRRPSLDEVFHALTGDAQAAA